MNRGRCYPYQEGDSDKIPGSAVTSTTSLAVSFRKGLTEAAEVFDAYMEAKTVAKPPMPTKYKRSLTLSLLSSRKSKATNRTVTSHFGPSIRLILKSANAIPQKTILAAKIPTVSIEC